MLENQRLIVACKQFLDRRVTGKLRSLSGMAKSISYSSNYFSDLKNNKSRVTIDAIDAFADKYPISKKYVLMGEGDPLIVEPEEKSNILSEPIVCYIKKDVDSKLLPEIKKLTEQSEGISKQLKIIGESLVKKDEHIETLIKMLHNEQKSNQDASKEDTG